ncbi:MAG: hypothetical protein ACTHMI_13390 [Mucilaginibacter sp.]
MLNQTGTVISNQRFDNSFKTGIKELLLIDARLSVLDSFTTQSQRRIEDDKQIGHDLITSGLAFRDITRDINENNLFIPSSVYRLNRLNLSQEIDLILSRESLLQVSQAYELLETFLYNIVAEYILLNPALELSNDFKGNRSTFEAIRLGLKRMKNRINNRHLTEILRNHNSQYKYHEKTNIYDLDFSQWLEMFGEVRNVVTHNRMRLTEYFDPSALWYNLFVETFSVTEVDGELALFVTVNNSKHLIQRVADYIFFVYKTCSDEYLGQLTNFRTIEYMFKDPINI